MTQDRRQFLARAGSLLYTVAGASAWLTPAEARTQGADLRVLDPARVRTLEAFGEILVPGATAAGIAHFVDSQLAVDPNDSLLVTRLFNIEPPYGRFYTGVLDALEALSRLGRPASPARLPRDPQRCRRCRLWHGRGLSQTRRALHGAHRAAQPLVMRRWPGTTHRS
ncbi:MAG: hypothetical protein IT486_01205 [Gammaproteobacteria bacterium]|nr:hypothetical protein [Gammaproteobacteria bacterium]